MRIVVRPRISASSPSSTAASLAASSPVVGSSSTSTGGSRSSVRATPIRWRWPPRERDALRAEFGVVAHRQPADELVGGGGAGRGDDVLARGLARVGDVVVHGAAEQHGVLEHDRDLLAQPRQRAVAGVAPVEQHAPGRRVEEARDQRRRAWTSPRPTGPSARCAPPARCAARARRARGAPPRSRTRRRRARRRPARAAPRYAPGRLGEHVVGGHQLGDPVGLRHRRRDLGQLAREAAHRALRLARVGGEHEQLARG